MADLSTLNPAQPLDTEAVAQGASRMRQERDAIITSFGLEHHLEGSHKFLQGGVSGRPAPMVGKDGRIYINIDTQTVDQQFGGIWAILHAVGFGKTFDASTVLLADNNFHTVSTLVVNTPEDARILCVEQMTVTTVPSGATSVLIFDAKFNVDGVDLQDTSGMTWFSGDTITGFPRFPYIAVGVKEGLSAGAHTIILKAAASAQAASTQISNRSLFIFTF